MGNVEGNSLEEKRFFNALNEAYCGDYRALEKAQRRHGSWSSAWTFVAKDFSKIDPEDSFRKLEKAGVALLLSDDAEFPSVLREIPWPPFGLYYKGELPSSGEAIAIVGTRKATEQGATIARGFAEVLARRGLVVVSGLALGIDAAAHEGAIKGGGRTIAVLPTGLDRVYPRQNEALTEKILATHGALVSEYPFGSPAYKTRFLERNRIVSGLTLGVVIVEAPRRSGALATARFALDQNRDVLVVPGSITQRNYEGSHDLLRSGALLVTSPEDVLSAFNLDSETSAENSVGPQTLPLDLDENQKAIVHFLQARAAPASVEVFVSGLEMSITLVNQTLTHLVIKNIIKESGGQYYI